jgi:hypothetical protein
MGPEQLQVVLTLMQTLEDLRAKLMDNDLNVSKIEFNTTDSEQFYYLSDCGPVDGWIVSPDSVS